MRKTARTAEIAKYPTVYADPAYRMGDARRAAAERELHGLTGSLLDVGCGRGEVLEIARRQGLGPVKGTEVVPALVGGDVVRAEAHALPFPDDAFDHVTCFDVLEHLTPADTEPVLRELARVARKTITVTAADYPHEWGGVDLHVNRRPYEEWDRLLRANFADVQQLGAAGASRCWRVFLQPGLRTPPVAAPREKAQQPAPFEDLRDRHRGETFIVLGGGRSLHDEMSRAPAGIRISANEHGCRWGRCDYIAALDDIPEKVRGFGLPVIGRMPLTVDYLADELPGCRWTGTQAVYFAAVMGARLIVLAGMDLYQDLPPGAPGGAETPLATHLEAWQNLKNAIPVPVRALGGPLVDLFGRYDPAETLPLPVLMPRPAPPASGHVRVRSLVNGELLARRYRMDEIFEIRPDELLDALRLGFAVRA